MARAVQTMKSLCLGSQHQSQLYGTYLKMMIVVPQFEIFFTIHCVEGMHCAFAPQSKGKHFNARRWCSHDKSL
jgi:hypothetical protein